MPLLNAPLTVSSTFAQALVMAAVARSGGPGPVSYGQRRHAVGQGDLWGEYQLKGMYPLLKRLKGKKKVPRPLATNTSLEAQEEWKRGDWGLPSSRPG